MKQAIHSFSCQKTLRPSFKQLLAAPKPDWFKFEHTYTSKLLKYL